MITPCLVWIALASNPAATRAVSVETASPPPLVSEEETKAVTWTGSLTVGAKYTGGNTDIRGVNAGLDAVRRAQMDRYTLKAWWNYSQQSGVINERNAGTSLKYDYFLAEEKTFLFAVAGTETDSLANVDLRYYAGGGAGYQFLEEDKTSLHGELGLTYFDESFDGGGGDSFVTLRGSYDLSHQLSETVRFEQNLQVFPSVQDTEDFYGKLESRLKANLTETMFAQLQNVLEYDNTPAKGADRLDNQVILSVGWSF